MGDRANIYVVDRARVAYDDNETTGIYLYTHWAGSEWPEMLRTALALPTARRRWNDGSYLLRIVADSMFKNLRDEETGGGISTYPTDNEHLITILDIERQMVAWAPEGSEDDRLNWRKEISFADFVALARADYPEEM